MLKENEETLKNHGMQGNKELLNEPYKVVRRGRSDAVDEAVRGFQSFPKYDKLLQYSLRLIAAKRYTVFELRKKLIKYGERGSWHSSVGEGSVTTSEPSAELASDNMVAEMIDKVIARLEELKYLDDKKFVENYVADRVEFKPRGKFLIKRELKLKGIEEKAIEECLKNLPIDELEIALSTLRKREKLWQAYPLQKKKEKAFRYLAGKGFEPDAIYKAVKRCYDLVIE